MLNLLTDSFVPVLSRDRVVNATLPGLLASLALDSIDGFPGLTAHQAQAWYQFLAQLGALAIRHGRDDTPPDDPAAWLNLLKGLAPDNSDTAWSLAVDDPARPAFLQPPTERIDTFKSAADTPDGLDVLVTAKNHDRKRAQARGGEPHLWLYALITLQTAQGFSGRGNPGIARMNGGFSSRVLVDRRPNGRWGPRFVRAVRMLIARRERILEIVGDDVYRAEGGLALTWLETWDEDTPLPMTELDPFFIEVCRRVRLTAAVDGQLSALTRPANKPRVAAQVLKGRLGDPWVPVNRGKAEASALTVSANGFDYRLAQRILFDRAAFAKTLSLIPLPGEESEDSEIQMSVLVRGQGKTEGLHERIIPLPRAILAHLSLESDDDDDHPSTLAELSYEMVKLAGEARKVLRQAVLVYLQGPEHPDFQKSDAAPIVTGYDRGIDARFFDALFTATEVGSERASLNWQRFLSDEAFRLARNVWSKMSPPSSRREKARAASEAVLRGGLRKRLPGAYPTPDPKELPA